MLRFGTDGVRGVANADLTPELVLALGRAAVRVLGRDHAFVIGRDTRRSGPLLEHALVAGIAAEGADVELLGVAPTPMVAYTAATRGGPGAVISASHNPFADNGVKIFAAGGRKLDDQEQSAIEAALDDAVAAAGTPSVPLVVGAAVGTATTADDARAAYVDHLVGVLDGRVLGGLRVVVDCGHGAASAVAAEVLGRAGADVIVRNAEPDGTNINDGCGATAPEVVAGAVIEHHAQVGLALDGDADRVIAADERGDLVDGDHILAIAARDLDERDRLTGRAVVGTVMANLGLRRALADAGIGFVETPVGDRAVLDAMAREKLVLGGEQSGHIIFSEHATTGDGLLTGLVLLDLVVRAGRPLSELAAVVTKWPQVLRNVGVVRRDGLDGAARFWDEVAAAEEHLGADGRVLVRTSGTEPVVRVMVEAREATDATRTAEHLSAVLEEELGAD